ncbi:terpene synthase family protein [Streptomyces sp. NPDC055709]
MPPSGSPGRRLALDERCDQVRATATRWAATRPFIQTPRIDPLVSLLATAAPFADTAALTTQVRATLWVFAVDDLFDSGTATASELRDFVTSCAAVLTGHLPPGRSTDLLDALTEIRAEVSRYQLFASLADLWNEGIVHLLKGMVDEARWARGYRCRGAPALPSLDRYLDSAYRSIGVLPHVRTALVTLGEAGTPQHVPFLVRLEKEAGMAVRLANDLRSEAKEAEEGTVNAVVILEQAAVSRGLAPTAALLSARQTVQQQLDHRLARCAQLTRHAVTATGRPEAMITTTAILAASLYQEGDFLPGEDRGGD